MSTLVQDVQQPATVKPGAELACSNFAAVIIMTCFALLNFTAFA